MLDAPGNARPCFLFITLTSLLYSSPLCSVEASQNLTTLLGRSYL